MNAARLWLEALERSLPPDPSRVWNRRSPFQPTNRTPVIEIIAIAMVGRNYGENLEVELDLIGSTLFAKRRMVA